MRALTAKLLEGSGVDEKSHPWLVSLLELAAAGPGIPSGSALDTPALRKRLLRQWGRVREAFRACVAVGVTDSDLRHVPERAGAPCFRSGDWRAAADNPLGVRLQVAGVLERAANAKGGALKAFPIASVSDLRKAQKANGLPALDAPLRDAPGKVESKLFLGRRVVVSWLLFRLRLFVVLQSDEFGRVDAVAYLDSLKVAKDVAEEKPMPRLRIVQDAMEALPGGFAKPIY